MFGEDRQPMPQNYYDNIFKPKLSQATQAIKSLLRERMMKKKEIIDITKKMCLNLEHPTDCLYDKPDKNGETCLMQDRKIPKEQCGDYKDMQVEYEDFAQYNQAIDEFNQMIEEI